MARKKRPDYVAPASRARAPRPSRPQPPAAAGREPSFPPGTLRRVLVGGLLLAVVLAAVTWYVVRDRRADRELARALTAGSCRTDQRTDPTGPAGSNHVADPVFSVEPPAGGNHTPQVARAGVYRGDRVPPDGPLVHALEHGYVVVWHRPGLSAADAAALDRLARKREGDVIVAERASMGEPVAATAWGQRLLCGRVEPEVLDRFAEAHVGNGPEDVERG